MRAVAPGDCKAPPRPETTTLFSLLSPDVFELLNVLVATPTTTVKGLAQHVGTASSGASCDFPHVQLHILFGRDRRAFGSRTGEEQMDNRDRCHPTEQLSQDEGWDMGR